MNILIAQNEMQNFYGGIQTFSLTLHNELVSLGYKVDIYTHRKGLHPYYDKFHLKNIRINKYFPFLNKKYDLIICSTSKALKDINIQENAFGIEPELTIKLAKKKLVFYEVPISYEGRSYDEGKKIRLRDAFIAIYCIFKYSIFR